jgi:hypothetical protein
MRSPFFGLTLLVVCSVLATQPVAAQRASELRSGLSVPPLIATMTAEQSLRRSLPKSYWKEGALIGAIPGSVIAFFAFKDWGDSTKDGVLASIVVGGVAGMIGALIGDQFPKGGN